MSAGLLRKAAKQIRRDCDGDGFMLAVADWLQKSAETYERLEDDLRGLSGAPTIEQVYGYDFTEALAVARAYLGRDS